MLHSRGELIARAVQEFDLLDPVVARLVSDQWDLVTVRRAGEDPWTVKDALAHITARKQGFVAGIRGEPVSRGRLGVHAYNHITFAEWHDRAFGEVLDWHRRTHQELMDALRHAPDGWFERDETAHWPAAIDAHSANHRKRDIEHPLKSVRTRAGLS